jgi:hypothetical protein
MLAEMAKHPGHYLFAMPRIDLIEERAADLHRAALAAGTRPVVRTIHGKATGRVPVVRALLDAVEEHANDPHAIVLITHEAMMSADLSGFAGWHARIDEVPAAVHSGELDIRASVPFFQAAYDLEPIPDAGWCRVRVRDDAPNMGAVMRDGFLDKLAAFHKRARSSQGVYVDVGDWRDACVGRRAVRWWTAWTPLELAAFETVVIAGAGYQTSIAHLATQAWLPKQVRLRTETIDPGPRQGRAHIKIGYFTHGHVGSTAWWKTEPGMACLAKVCRYLEGVTELGYWSGNEAVANYFRYRVPGKQVPPRVEGTNELRGLTSCAFIYSSKAQPADATLMDVFGLERDDIERARQTEDLVQFVMRGALRQQDFDGVYTIYVYDLAQAETLARYLRTAGIADTVELFAIPKAGIMDVARPRPGRPRQEMTSDPVSFADRETARRAADRERQQRRRERQKAERAAAGTLRPRGRPRKGAPELRPAP